MLRGMSTINLWAEDLSAATRWYTELLGVEPYFTSEAAGRGRLVSLGAKQLEGLKERGPGFVTASVVDPFGNVLGIMYNRHYLDVLGKRGEAQ